MTQRDWNRLRKRVANLKRLERSYAAIAWFALGGFVSVLLGALTWTQPYFGLGTEGRLAYGWIWIALVGLGALFATAAVLGFVFTRAARAAMKISVDQVLEDMDDVHPAPLVL